MMLKKVLLLCLFMMVAFVGFGSLVKETSALTYNATDDYDWEAYNFYSTYWGMRITGAMYPDAEFMTFTIPVSQYNLDENGGIDSAIVFTLTDTPTSITKNIVDLVAYRYGNTYYLNLSTVDGDDVRDAYEFTIYIMQSWSSAPSQFVEYWNLNATVLFEYPMGKIVRFYDQFTLYEYSLFYDLPTAPTVDPTPPAGYEFVGWRLARGDIYTFDYMTPSLLEITYVGELPELRLYATYREIGATDYDPDEPTPESDFESLLTGFGLYNNPGFIFLYALVIIVATLAMLSIKLPLYVHLFIDAGITTAFSVFGFLPIIVSIVMWMLLAVVFLMSFKGGTDYAK